ncbi:hypothetical protein [Ornithinibacillus halotolerans]|uniref:Uncharacterized protein n=1 Tax=Ornithinibacillus halotolerans TaxID=1274357 RepID=A0A916RXZ2_9BACI|nr:hypothetical protein [Ornithinibacillus halotolerans]GGA72824.1 hypothetical protein GCM10008025_15770 [Ornithinibacillus halotolerans]
MIENGLLKVLDPFRSIFRKFNIDYDMMRLILQMKLTMDARRVPTILSQSKKKEGNQFIKGLWIYGLYGLILIPFFFLGDNLMLQASLITGIAMFILGTSMISDFSSVILDVRDKIILNTKPIDSRTINAAKVMHVSIYLTLITGAFITIPAIVLLFVNGFFYFVIFIIEIILLDIFILAITSLAYILILRLFDGEKLKDMINYVQIMLAIGMVIGYQIIIRVYDVVGFELIYHFSWWHLLIPPLWFGAPFELLLNQDYSLGIILLSILAIIVPIVSIFAYYVSMPSFERNLQKLMEESKKSKKRNKNLGQLLERLLCFSKEERAFYRFASIMISRERDFKLKVYPSLGMGLIFPLIFLYNNLGYQSFEALSESKSYLTIYFCNIIIGVVVFMLQYSGKYKGAWVFYTTPIKKHSIIYSATLKAFFVKLYLPILFILSIVYVWIFSFRIIPDLIVILFSGIILMLISYKMFSVAKIPFTEPIESAQQGGGSSVKIILLMILVGIFATIHFAISTITFGIYVYLFILVIVSIVLWKIIFR